MLFFVIFTIKKTIKTKVYILFFFLQISFFATAKNEISYCNKLINSFQTATNRTDLKKIFKQNKTSSNLSLDEVEVIYYVFDALYVSKKYNVQNPESKRLFNKAEDVLYHINNKEMKLWVYTQIGFYYYSFYDYEKASDYFLKSSRILNEISNDQMFDAETILMKNAYFFQTIKENATSIDYLKRALLVTSKESKNYANFLNALGNCYYEIDNKKEALKSFEEAKIISKKNNDTLRYAKVIGDIAKIYIDNNQTQEAEKLLTEDILLSKKIGETKNLIFAKLRLAELYLHQKNYNKAKYLLRKVEELTKDNENLKIFYFDALILNLPIVCNQNKISEELDIRRKIDSLRPIIEKIDGNNALNHVNWKIQTEKMKFKLETEHLKIQKANFFIWTFIITSLLLVVLIVLLFIIYKRRLKIQKITFENKLLNKELERLKTENALNEANDSLKSFKAYLFTKNRKIIELESSLKELEKSTENEASDEKIELRKLISSHLMTDENWKMFKNTFIREEPELYNHIQSNFTDLSESNLRLVLLHKIGLNNQEIANILGLTIHAIKKAKQRLRKKHGEMIEDLL